MVVMPTSMCLSASLCQPPTSLTLALSSQALAIQLSPAAVASLLTLAKILHMSAMLPGQQSDNEEHAQLHPQERIGTGHAQTHARTQGHAQSHTRTQGHAASTHEAASHGHVPMSSEDSDFDSRPVSAAAKAVHDDLRCGLFRMASVPASRPGEQWS